jgi:ribosomal protein S18 acetylase RimI-like enzyme
MYRLTPGGEAGFAAILTEHSQREGFRLCAAFDRESTQLVGFGYGFTGGPGQYWRDALAGAMGPEAAEQWLTGHFEFAEFGIVPTMQRRGIGTRVYASLFDGMPHRRAVLTVRTENQPARRFYERNGWEALYRDFFAPEGHGPYIIMGRELSGAEMIKLAGALFCRLFTSDGSR